jgi:hypothetical protein
MGERVVFLWENKCLGTGYVHAKMMEPTEIASTPEGRLNEKIEMSLFLAARLIDVLHQARVHREVALGALKAAVSHVECMEDIGRV